MTSSDIDSDYLKSLAILDTFIGRGIRASLNRFQEALQAAKRDRPTYPIFLIAGTNGKGSTTAMIERALCLAGYRVGALSSPHLIDVRERIRLNGDIISTHMFVKTFHDLLPIFEQHCLTYYEALILLGMVVFSEQNIDVAVFEVGMGGRFDATNAVDPTWTAITTVSFDHEAILGPTLEAIASEKSGIARPNVPLVSGVNDLGARAVIEARCRELGAPFIDVSDAESLVSVGAYGIRPCLDDAVRGVCDTPLQSPQSETMPDQPLHLLGDHQKKNARVASTVLSLAAARLPKLTEDTIRRGVTTAQNLGRLTQLASDPLLFVDGAHNEEAMRALRDFIVKTFPERRVRLIFSVMADKAYPNMLASCEGWVSSIAFIPLNESRALPFDDFKRATRIPSTCHALEEISLTFLRDHDRDAVWIVCGSLYLVGAFLKRWGDFYQGTSIRKD